MTKINMGSYLNLMKLGIRLLILITFTGQLADAQVLKGKITDNSGQPVQYATVYIQELKQGTTSNTRGDYELRLPGGKYMVIYQSLGYEPVFVNIDLSDTVLIRNISLPEQIYEIPEVRISPSGEDPAMSIMRKVIGLAPYYLNYINYYKAEVYIKGNLLIKRIPKLIGKSMRMRQSDEDVTISAGGKPEKDSRIMKEGDSFFMESFNEVEFTAPDKYVQKVISYNSTFPEQGDDISPMDYIQASFYQPVLADMAISPLSPQAFSSYNFKYIGTTFQGKYTINKIEVIPKYKSQQLFAGTIFIIEDLWCLYSVDLTNENLVGKIRVRELYIPVQEEIWMPVSHQFDIDLQIIGIRADVGYVSSVRYLDVKPNDKLQKPRDLATGFAGRYLPDTAVTKTNREINRILQKEELTNRDMIKLGKLMEKESKNTRSDSGAKSLEIKDNTTQIVEKDARKRDSTYWADIRPIPLSEIELRSIEISDSIKNNISGIVESTSDTVSNGTGKKSSRFSKTLNNLLMGHTWSDTTGFSFTNGGLIDVEKLSFNTVDGFVYGIDFRINKRFKNNKSVAFYPDIRYAFSREKVMWRLNGNYSTGGMKPKQFSVRTGMTSRDIGTGGGINPFINSISTLFMERNYMKLYESRYLTFAYKTEIKNGLTLELSAGFENRKVMENNTSFSIINTSREYSSNLPVNEYLTTGSNIINFVVDQKHIEFVTNVTFTPYQKYRIYGGNKVPQGSEWPTFIFTWKHGANMVPTISGNYRHFDMFSFEVSKKHETGAFSELKWRAGTGGFADNRNISYFDFFHFNPQPLQLLINNYDDAFMLPAFYSLSTPEFYGEAHLKYTTPYLLLKFLPGLSRTLIRENIIISYLGSRFHKNYTEIGYSLSEIFFLGEAGIFVGFDDLKYRSFGLRIILKLN
ncbi:MAG TPA: hypothetical protein DCZ51_10340 [Bacteroidales bacterium]|nr:hypothetical protein [Bacteroidales bacterium]